MEAIDVAIGARPLMPFAKPRTLMNRFFYLGLLVSQLVITSMASALEFKPQVAEIKGIIDGDTFRIRFSEKENDSAQEYVANLIGVDAPGFGEVECESQFVASMATQLLLGKRVWVEWDSGDKQTRNGRLLVYISPVEDRGIDLNAHFIESGWAWVPRKYRSDRKQKYLRLEQRARAMKKGIWGSSCAPAVMDHKIR